MALPIWIPDALRSEQRTVGGIYWRCVEAQHVVSTLQLVDTLEEQSLLEDMLEESKPPVPLECEGLHYLYMSPFRYGRYPTGSRFRRAGLTPGVFYASEEPRTAVIETAFHLLLFYADSPGTPFPLRPSEHTTFDVPIRTDATIDLTEPPFSDVGDLWTRPSDFEPCQQLEEAARAEQIALIRTTSVRDPQCRANAAILTCAAFAARRPTRTQTWRLFFNPAGVHAVCEFPDQRFSLPSDVWNSDERLNGFVWSMI